MLGRVIGLMAIAGPSGEEAEKPRVQYTLPAMELRRLVWEAKARGESFAVEYATLEGARAPKGWGGGRGGGGRGGGGAEAWRAESGKGSLTRYRYDAATRTERCSKQGGYSGSGAGGGGGSSSFLFGRRASACDPNEPALLPPPPAWILWLAAFQPLPILQGEGWGEVHCYGP